MTKALRRRHVAGVTQLGSRAMIGVQRLSKLVRLVAGTNPGNAVTSNRPDVAAAAAAIGLLVAQQAPARSGLLQLRGLKPLVTLLHHGTLAEQSVAANVLFDMSQGQLSSLHISSLLRNPGASVHSHLRLLYWSAFLS